MIYIFTYIDDRRLEIREREMELTYRKNREETPLDAVDDWHRVMDVAG